MVSIWSFSSTFVDLGILPDVLQIERCDDVLLWNIVAGGQNVVTKILHVLDFH